MKKYVSSLMPMGLKGRYDGSYGWLMICLTQTGLAVMFRTLLTQPLTCASLKAGLHVLKMSSCKPCPEGLKGQALLDGMAAALRAQPDLDAVIYINLNLKVNAVFSAPGLLQLLRGNCDAAIGSRAGRDGGGGS